MFIGTAKGGGLTLIKICLVCKKSRKKAILDFQGGIYHKSKFESKLQKSKRLQLKLFYQKITYKIIQLYNREQLKIELEEIHDTIFSNPRKKEFHNRINKIFEIQQ